MATIPLDRSVTRTAVRKPFTVAAASPVPANASLVKTLYRLGRELLGLMLFLTGSAMLFTLWLIPVGLPLALVGLALMAYSWE
jgi:hypothetical protein